MAELLKMENQILEAELQETINMTAEIEQKLAEKHELEVKTHEDRLNVLKNANHLLKVTITITRIQISKIHCYNAYLLK